MSTKDRNQGIGNEQKQMNLRHPEKNEAATRMQKREQNEKQKRRGKVKQGQTVKDSRQANSEKQGQSEKNTNGKQKKLTRIRLIPIWLRLVIIFLLAVFSLAAGAMVGYGIIGDGGNPFDILKQSTWTHIIDLVNKK